MTKDIRQMTEQQGSSQKSVSRITHYASRFTDSKGFTLIELAIVLVIIGIIIGAVLKGQDLIQSARAKKFVNDAGRLWETITWTYLDRMGRFPGDSGKNGIIGDEANDNPKTDITNANFINPPTSPVTLGSYSFYVFLGNDNGSPKKNVLVICKDNTCNGTFTDDELDYIRAFDVAIDGSADGANGQVRAASAVTGADSNKWLVTGVTLTNNDWSSTTDKALVYYFDRKK